MRGTILLVTAATIVVVAMMASTSLAVAQGNPKVIEGVLPVPACDPGQGETSGTTPFTDPAEPDFGAVQGAEIGPGGTTCFVPLPEEALPDDEVLEF